MSNTRRLNRILFNSRTPVWILLHVILVLVGVVLSLLGEPWAVAVGTSVVATGIAGIVIYIYIARTERIELALENLSKFGLWEIFDGRSTRIREEYDERCEKMKEGLDVMGYGLGAFLQDHAEDLKKWKHQANIRILVIDPAFPTGGRTYAEQRDAEEGRTAGTIGKNVEELVAALRPFIGTEGGKTFEIRYYRCLPSINVFRVDDDLLWGPYLMHQPSRNSPTFLVRRGGIIFERIAKHFDDIWRDAKLSTPV